MDNYPKCTKFLADPSKWDCNFLDKHGRCSLLTGMTEGPHCGFYKTTKQYMADAKKYPKQKPIY